MSTDPNMKSRFLLVAALVFGVSSVMPARAQDPQQQEHWTVHRGNRINDQIRYLREPDPETRVIMPLKLKVRRGVLIVGDDLRGDLLRMRRIKDYVLLDVVIFTDPGYRGKITVGGPRFTHKNVTLFYGKKRAFGDYFLFEEIRAFHDPIHDLFPASVIRFFGADQGVVYLDPMGSGEPQAIVNFSSVPYKN